MAPEALVALVLPRLDDQSAVVRERLLQGIASLTKRIKTVDELVENSKFYSAGPAFPLTIPKAAKQLEGDGLVVLAELAERLSGLGQWNEESLEEAAKAHAQAREIGLGKIAQPLRAALTGSNASPGIFEVMRILGRNETLARLAAVPGIER